MTRNSPQIERRTRDQVLPQPAVKRLHGSSRAWFRDHVESIIPGRLESMRVWETPSSWTEFTVEND